MIGNFLGYIEKPHSYVKLHWLLFGQLLGKIGQVFTPAYGHTGRKGHKKSTTNRWKHLAANEVKRTVYGGRHSSVDSSAPTVCGPRFNSMHHTPSSLLNGQSNYSIFFSTIYYLVKFCSALDICDVKRTKINKKRPG